MNAPETTSGRSEEPGVLVMARAPRPGRCKTRLEPLLGGDGCARLQAALIARAARWALAVAPAAAFLSHDPPDAEAEVRALVPARVAIFPQRGEDLGRRLVAAAATAFDAHDGPLLVVGTDMPTLGPAHAAGALDDLREGCDVVLGPAHDGGYYLIGLARPEPALFALPVAAWGGPEVLARTLAVARERGLRIGLLRGERDLDTPADVRAGLADPLWPADVAAALEGGQVA